MIITHAGQTPRIDPAAWIAPDATVCGDVEVAAGARVLHGARIIGEAGGRIRIGRNVIVMENAVVRAGPRHPCSIGDHCLIGPNAHVVGAAIEEQCFIATGAAIFHGAHLGKGSEVRVNGIVHLKTRLEAGSTVPIGWVAVGDPARILPADKHDEIWEIQKPLNFPLSVYGLDRSTPDLMVEITKRLSASLGAHRDDCEA
ncbi:MAG TPA: gamma carbonic anhydrase family protein [Dongiaceae bacterium]|jgi:carbonic anhydrase/acetyltransferase-like protein (isoleucine patch superfamily)|nr:gamma carbonic anhydrase family protein [Dongiaceae bacterium]